jgi:hypothetical protein
MAGIPTDFITTSDGTVIRLEDISIIKPLCGAGGLYESYDVTVKGGDTVTIFEADTTRASILSLLGVT